MKSSLFFLGISLLFVGGITLTYYRINPDAETDNTSHELQNSHLVADTIVFTNWFVYKDNFEQLRGKVKSLNQNTFQAVGNFDQIESGAQLDQGNLMVTFDPNGIVQSFREFDRKGRLISEMIPIDSQHTKPKNMRVSRIEKVIYEYSPNKIISGSSYAKNGTKSRIFELKYNESNIIESIHLFAYDKAGDLKKELNCNLADDSYVGAEIYSTSRRNIKIHLNKFNHSDSVFIDGSNLHTIYEHKYDPKGNWTSIVERKANFEPMLLAIRDIEYYSDQSFVLDSLPEKKTWSVNFFSPVLKKKAPAELDFSGERTTRD